MQEYFEETSVTRVLYSPVSRQFLVSKRQATGSALERASGLNSGRDNTHHAPMQLSRIVGAKVAGTKEAHITGMIRCYRSLTSILPSSAYRVALAALFLFLATAATSPSAHAQSASGWNKRGAAAELHQDYDTAYEDYLKAYQKSPKDMRYQARVDRMRFQAAAQHVDRGRILRQSGDLPGALNQFTRALQIDPSNEAASQEIRITEGQDHTGAIAPTPPGGMAAASALVREVGSVSAPLVLKPLSDEPITLHTVEDTKNIYMAIGELAGLNVLFDPDYQSRRIPIDLKSVSLADALRIVGTIAGTFYKPVTPDTIYVAANTHTKHQDLDDVAVQTFFLTNAAQQADANDIVTALRNVLSPEDKVLLVNSQNAIVMRAPPQHLILAEKLINDLDRTRAEVVVDVAILEVNRDKVRNLGITLPQSIGFTPQATPTATNTTATTTTTTAATSSSFTLNTLGNINATNFGVTVGGGTLNALLTDADTRVLQSPSIRATDGQNAKLKIGSKIPIASGTLNSGVGGAGSALGGYGGVQTSFTYLDVGVNIDMTPTIHLDGEVSLKLTVESSQQTGSVTISSVTEPIIGQRSDSTTVQLRDGEPCFLAGILTNTDNSTNSGTPGLSSIPLLKYFFGSVYKENDQDEIVFVLVPHIVRESVLTGLNTRAIDTGTAGDIQIRQSEMSASDLAPVNSSPNPPSTMTAANAASAMAAQMKQQAMPPAPGSNPAPTMPIAPANVPGARPLTAGAISAGLPVTLNVMPVNSTHEVGSVFQTSILLSNAHDVFAVPLNVQYDPRVLQLVNVDAGGLLGGDGQPVAIVHRDDGHGGIFISASRPPGVAGVSGQGEVCTLTFKAIAPGDATISLSKVGATNSFKANLPATSSSAVVHVK
jgi:general secretion pathway protein D